MAESDYLEPRPPLLRPPREKLKLPDESLSLHEDYVIAAAIDFGTTFSGYAFSFKHEQSTIRMNKNWSSDLGYASHKAPTSVLTRPDGSFHSFGFEAETEYENFDPETDQIGGEGGYNLYRHFKMLLHEKGLSMRSKVHSTDGHIRPAIDIFTMVLKHLHQHILEALDHSLKEKLDDSLIRWVLTVPAIWNEQSKEFMREAAYRAGMISEKNSKKLVIALEPEAASTFCRSLRDFSSGSQGDMQLKVDQKILIIDAGGGTVDIVAHQVRYDGKVTEVINPTGGPWGAMNVDKEFEELIRQVFGGDFITSFQLENRQLWHQLMIRFEIEKRHMKDDGRAKLKVPLPFGFSEAFKSYCKRDITEWFSQSQYKGVSFSNGVLILSHDLSKSLFKDSVEQIVGHVRQLLSDVRLVGLDHLLLVGGYGESKILQNAIRESFGKTVRVIIPSESQIAIIKGAVLFGHNPTNIYSRVSKYTYGQKVYLPYKQNRHDPRKRQTIGGKDLCEDIFQVLVTKGENLITGSSKAIKTGSIEKGRTSIELAFYKSDKENVRYIDDPGVELLATAALTSRTGTLGNKFETKVTFGHTEMLIEARDISEGDTYPVQVSLDYFTN